MTLRHRLTAPAALIALALSAALIAVGVWAGQSIVSVMSDRLIRETTATMQGEIGRLVGGPDRALTRAVRGLDRHGVPLNDTQAIARELYLQLTEEPSIGALYVGNDSGGLVAVSHVANGATVFEITDGFRAGIVQEYEASPGGGVGRLLATYGTYNSRVRPWYARSRESGQRSWTDPYLGSIHPVLSISLSAPVFNPDGSIALVCGTDLPLTLLADFMRGLQLGKNGRSFVVDMDGRLIGASGGVQPVRVAADGRQSRLDASAADDPVVRGAGRYLSRHPELRQPGAPGPILVSFTMKSLGTTYAAIAPFEAPGGIHWTIVSALPAWDFLQPVWHAAYMSLALAAAIVGAALVLGLWALRAALRPLVALTDTAEAMARGEWRDVPEAGRTDEVGKLASAFGVMAHRLRETLDGLRDSEQRLREFAEAASDWFWESGPDHRFTFITSIRAAIALGPDRGIGAQRWDLATDLEEDPEKWRQHRAILDAHLPFRGFRYRTRKEDGSTAYVQVSGQPIFDAAGRFLCYRGVGNEVTASVRAEQAEEALRQAEAELAHVNRVATLGELTASIAHEINQPLAAVITNAGSSLRWLSAASPDLGEVRQGLERIVRDGNRASEVLRRIRALVGKSPTRKDWFDINAAVLEVVALTSGEIRRSDVTLRTSLAADLPTIQADRIQVQQVLLNMIVNATQAMSDATEGPREIYIVSTRDETDYVLVEVRDSGPGLAPDSIDRLFMPFYTTKTEGMGMGLAICRSIIEAHGGRLWATENTPAGAAFHFTLPLG